MPVPDDSSTEESVYDAVRAAPFQPFEPEPVQPTSGPTPSSTTPGTDGDTSGADGEPAPAEPQAEQPAKLPEFDPRYREEFTGLLYLGRLEDKFTLWGHEFVIRTLTTEELAEIALYMHRYEGTRSQNAVYQSATCAAAVVRVDGQPLPQSLTLGDSGLSFRIEWVMKNWMPAVREEIWQRVFALEGKAREVLRALGESSG